MSPQVLLALRWMPRCLALGAAVIIEKNISYCCRPNLAFFLHQVLHTIAKFLVFDGFSGLGDACATCVRQELSKELERQGNSAADFSISKDEASTASVDKLYQCLITITVRNYSLMFRGNLRISVCACCLLSCHWTPLRRPGSIFFTLSSQDFVHVH